ncbi:60S acidic ribosomal protein P0-like [Schistocerca gregaria]|uniref:60S acidic ribosomal protein P0-like n=1 Tax=Schistocerca gregaria TaxID=7010 RepID=UPI00211F38AA|nr:60S acidic ribosomal protein P0-like [Schistocerca gregaria]
MPSKDDKRLFIDRVVKLADEYPRILIVNANNVGSNHMHSIRRLIRGLGILLMGKNTLIRKAIREHLPDNPNLEPLLPHIHGNIGLVFTKGDVHLLREKLTEIKVSVAAKPGSISPVDIVIPKGGTGLEPNKTSFLQVLNIPSKIEKGQIDILSDVKLVSAGSKVGASECALFSLLSIRPFIYSLKVSMVYEDGNIYSSSVLDITDDSILGVLKNEISNVAAISMATHLPTLAAFPHILINAYKDLLAISISTDYTFKESELIKEMISNPEAFQSRQPSTSDAAAEKHAEKQAEEESKKEESEDEGGLMDFGLFGDD